MSVLGFNQPIVTRGQIEKQTLSFLEDWFITFLAKIERDNQIAARSLATPKGWDVYNEFMRFPQDKLPFVAVVSPGLNAGRKKHIDGDGMVTAYWLIAIGAVVTARDMRSAKDLSGYYGAAIRAMMTYMPQLGGWASGVDWEDEKYDDLPRVEERSLAACRLVFTVEVQDVMNIYDAPRQLDGSLVPPEDPYAVLEDWPIISQMPTVNVTKET